MPISEVVVEDGFIKQDGPSSDGFGGDEHDWGWMQMHHR